MMQAGAMLSPDNLYRHLLWREWEHGHSCVLWIMLNPSTANAEDDDPTVRKIVKFSQRWGFKKLQVVNLFDWRATEVKKMMRAAMPCSDHNKRIIEAAAAQVDMIVCAWGTNGSYVGQDKRVLGWIAPHWPKLRALALTKDGHPKHPLYCLDAIEAKQLIRWKQ